MPPLPKPADQRRRRNAPMANTLKLPRAGRQGKPPVFPGELSEHDAVVWADLWRTPMAVAWELDNNVRTVARYLRVMRAAEESLASGDPSAALLSEVRQLEDRLGLTPMARLRLRWEIDGTDDVAAARAAKKPPARRRLKAVDPSAVARA